MELRRPSHHKEYNHTPETRQVEILRTFIHRERLTGSAAVVFNAMFPEQMPVGIFNPASIRQHEAVTYTEEQKKVASHALRLFGYISSKTRRDSYIGDEDLPELRIAFSGHFGAPTTHLNKLACVTLLGDQGQTSPMSPSRPVKNRERQSKITRKDHSKHLASMVIRDLVRMAIITPDLFITRVIEDMKRYGVGEGNGLPAFITPTYYQEELHKMVETHEISITQSQMQALALALEYGKYMALYAYLHDERTPAWGDTVMKAKKRFPGQTSLDYSEDEVLHQEIEDMCGDDNTGIPGFLKYFKMDTRFFVTMAKSLAKENDACLGGYLMKSKRKVGYHIKGGPPALESRASFDEDQISGTAANMMDLAKQILPGGYRHIYKKTTSVSKPNQPSLMAAELPDYPIGSFYERLQLLSYALIKGITREQLVRFCTKHKIPPKRVFIAAEEFQVGPNFRLMNHLFEDRQEILPITLHPRSLKRMLESFSALTYFHYQSDRRSATETLVQDILTTIHNWQITKIQPDNTAMKKRFTDIVKMAMHRSDYGYSQMLKDEIPIIPFIYKELFSRARRISSTELMERRQTALANGYHVMISRAQVYPIEGSSLKPGSLTLTQKGEVKPYIEVIDKRLNPITMDTEENPTSLPKRLQSAAAALHAEDYYYYIEFDDTILSMLSSLIKKSPTSEIQDLVKRALRYWTLDLVVENQIVTNPLSLHPDLLLTHEDRQIPLMEQYDKNMNLGYLMQAQSEELLRLQQ